MAVLVSGPRCIVYEDEHLLVVHKSAGLNTHSPAPYAGEGLYEWLHGREARWSNLAIIHRLDKATSGLIVFAKTKLANKSLTEQFTEREVRKTYVLLSAKPPAEQEFTVRSELVRVGEQYASRAGGDYAETRFRYIRELPPYHLLEAQPVTGRTHQIRVHCQDQGIPILGDALYGGPEFARVCLHSQRLELRDPVSGKPLQFYAETDFFSDPAMALRELMIEEELTDAFRWLHGGSDQATYYLERWGDFLLAQSESAVSPEDLQRIPVPARGVYRKVLDRQVARISQEEAAPKLVSGEAAPTVFTVRENGVRYEISFEQGYSVGLFLDQRENRRRLLTNYVGPDFTLFSGGLGGRKVLNAFSYTCGFSVCAALAGAHTTSLDLSRKYLEWGQRNFRLNGLEPTGHDFIYGDVFEWMHRLKRKGRQFDVILLDPPTFSRSKNGVFRAERDYGQLVTEVLPLLADRGILFASTNAHRLSPEEFRDTVQGAILAGGRQIESAQYVPQPFDFPISRSEPAYLKTLWLRMKNKERKEKH